MTAHKLVSSLLATVAALFFAASANAQTTLEWVSLSATGDKIRAKLDTGALKRLPKLLRRAAQKLERLAKRSAPKNIPKNERTAYAASQKVWADTAAKLGDAATSISRFGDTPGLNGGDMVSQMAAMNQQFLSLQEATQMESRKFSQMSSASTARHDIAMNAIRNMK